MAAVGELDPVAFLAHDVAREDRLAVENPPLLLGVDDSQKAGLDEFQLRSKDIPMNA